LQCLHWRQTGSGTRHLGMPRRTPHAPWPAGTVETISKGGEFPGLGVDS
jgi:hypothetical protein